MASSARRSYHSKGAEFGDGSEVDTSRGDRSNRNSGDSPNMFASAPLIDLRVARESTTTEALGLSGETVTSWPLERVVWFPSSVD